MARILNIAAYKFARLDSLKELREELSAQSKELGLKGTILLSIEGINLFMAGEAEAIERMVGRLRKIPGLEDLAPKYSESAEQPFTRMVVRIKKEIIAFGVEGIDPARRTSPKLAARELKQWLDDGRPITLLDTRNDYEVKLGTFRGAQTLEIGHFRQFPEAVRALPEEMKEQPIVMFCTGGIRCEKAGPFMEREGFRSVFQLDGGILKYFEEVGGEHYDGECFVFDQRVGVDPALRETEASQCFVCQTPLNADDQRDARHVAGVSCPYCHREESERMAERVAARNLEIERAVTPLPAAQPYENRRPIQVPGGSEGRTVLDFLSGLFAHRPREEWKGLCESGRLLSATGEVLGAETIVRGGERLFHLLPETLEPEVSGAIRVLHEDEAILVLDKPAPLPMHPCGRFNRNTLQHILNAVYAPQKPRPAHRLDANTTGVVVCARTRHFARLLQPQFAGGAVRKTYLAEVRGWPEEEAFICDAAIGAEPEELGSRAVVEEGLSARTEFRVLERRAGGTALLEVRPLTGRTNQIRVHLWHLGMPIVGDPAYRADGALGEAMTLGVDDPPMRLHAWRLEFRHPVTKTETSFESERPMWAK